MKRFLFIAGLVLSFTLVGAETKEKACAELTGAVVKKVIKQGEALEIKLAFTLGKDWRLGTWRLIGYEPYLPVAIKEAKFKRNPNKDPRWTSYSLVPPVWLKPEDREKYTEGIDLRVETADWPEGDYRIHCAMDFRKGNPPEYQSLFSPPLAFTIVKAEEKK